MYQPIVSAASKVDELLYLLTLVDLNKDKRKRESQTEIQHYLKIDLDLGRIVEKPSLENHLRYFQKPKRLTLTNSNISCLRITIISRARPIIGFTHLFSRYQVPIIINRY